MIHLPTLLILLLYKYTQILQNLFFIKAVSFLLLQFLTGFQKETKPSKVFCVLPKLSILKDFIKNAFAVSIILTKYC